MAGLNRAHLLFLLAGFILRNTVAQNTVAQDTCGAADHFALYVHDGNDDTKDGIYQATATFDAGSDFTKLPLATTENPTAVIRDVVEDLVYWAGNDVDIGKYIKRDTVAGGTTQAKSLITCTGTPLGVADGSITDGQFAASDEATDGEAERGRLDLAANLDFNGVAAAGKLGAWVGTAPNPNLATDPAWISVNLQGRPTITGVILQGREDMDMWTTKYAVEYSQDRITWTKVKDASAADAMFTGNTDRNTKVTQTFHTPVVALYIRILPLEWVDNVNTDPTMKVPALRFELLGCKVPQCVPEKLGVEDGSILDSQLTAKSGTASNGRLVDPDTGTTVTWTGATTTLQIANTGEYVEVFLGGRATVTGVIVQGGGTGTNYPTMIQAQYWDDSVTTPIWKTVKMGAMDWTGVTNLADALAVSIISALTFPEAVSTTRIRIFPHTIAGVGTNPTMRFEVVGCREPEISHLAVDGTCGSRKVYWIERGFGVGDKIHYADLEAANPTAQELTLSPALTSTSKIVDVELDVANNLIYFARQDGLLSYIQSARLLDGSIQNTYQVSSTNANIQSISIDQVAQNVYYSMNPGGGQDGKIGYVNIALAASSNMLIFSLNPDTGSTFYPYDIGVYGNYVYALEDKDSIVRFAKTLSTTPSTNAKTVVVPTVELNSLAVDLQFVKCIDFPTVTLNAPSYSKFETDGIVDVMIHRNGDRRCCSMVGITIGESEALEPEDFELISNTAVSGAALSYNVKFNAGEESVRLQFQIKQDNNVDATLGEGDEKFSVTLAGNECAALGTPSTAPVTIMDYYSCYFIAEGDSSKTVTEGEVDVIQTVNVMRSGYLQQPGEIDVAYEDGTATRFVDYDYSSNMVSVVGSTGSASFTIKGDNVIESPTVETFKMELIIRFGATNTLLCPDKSHEATISITDNDFRVYLKETHITTRENSGTVSIPVCREGYMGAGTVTVPFTVQDDSARAGSDYNNAINPSQVSFQTDQECTNAVITILNDEIGEPIEAFRLVISNPSSGELSGNNQTYIAISDDDLAFRIEFDKYTVNEASDLFLTLLREGDLGSDEDVFLVAVSGVATAGEDFVNFDRIEFKAGDSEKRAFIDIIDDSLDEPSEVFTLRLINGAGQILSTATVTIEDNDEPPSTATQQYSFDRSSLTINENVGMLEVVVVRTRTEQAGSVTVTTSPGTATSGVDYISLTSNGPGSVAEFAEGSGRAIVNVQINDDVNDESDESFTAQLSNPSDGTTSIPSNVLITIVDNDGDGNGGDGGGGDDGGGDNATLSTAALIGIILGAIAFALALLALAVCGCCLLMRQPQPTGIPAYPPPAGPPVYPPPVGYGPPRQPYNGNYAQNNRGFRPVY